MAEAGMVAAAIPSGPVTAAGRAMAVDLATAVDLAMAAGRAMAAAPATALGMLVGWAALVRAGWLS